MKKRFQFVIILSLILFANTGMFAGADNSTLQSRTQVMKAINYLTETTLMAEALEDTCSLSSAGIAKCLYQYGNGAKAQLNGNSIILKSYTPDIKLRFKSDGSCISNNSCSVIISAENIIQPVTIPLYLKNGKYIMMNEVVSKRYYKM